MADEMGRTFEDVRDRLSQIVDEVSAEDISLDDALKLYEEAVKLGLSACDLSEQDIEAHELAASSSAEDDASAPAVDDAPVSGGASDAGPASDEAPDAPVEAAAATEGAASDAGDPTDATEPR